MRENLTRTHNVSVVASSGDGSRLQPSSNVTYLGDYNTGCLFDRMPCVSSIKVRQRKSA
jgi:hypothetical protein